MAKKKLHPTIQSRAAKLMSAVEAIIVQGVVQADGYKNAKDFKRDMISMLDSSPHFERLAGHLHGAAMKRHQAEIKGSETARKVVPAGRKQAARREPGNRK